MIADLLYHWHPYELQAFICGLISGVLLTPMFLNLNRKRKP